jgi:cytoskeletal protein RodZ
MAAVNFTKKPMPQKEGLGDKLTKKRITLGYSIKDVEKAIHIRSKCIEAIENGRYDKLPPDVYVKGFIRSYAQYLNLDPVKVLKLYQKEKGLAESIKKASTKKSAMKSIDAPKILITPKTITITVISFLALIIVGYIGWQVNILASPPKLSLMSPSGDMKIYQSTLSVEGTTDPGTILYINDIEVGVGQNGEFNENVNLQEGVNVLTVKAQNKMGKYTEAKRTIVANIENSTTISEDKSIELKLTIGPKSALVQIEIDGKKITEKSIVMLAGVTQIYKANEKILVTTNNGGSVNASLNGKDLGPIGNDGEQINQKEFTKDI